MCVRSCASPILIKKFLGSGVGPVFASRASCRRRVVVASSSPRRRQLVNFSPLGGTFAQRHNPYLQSVKSGGSLARNARFGALESQNLRSFSRFA